MRIYRTHRAVQRICTKDYLQKAKAIRRTKFLKAPKKDKSKNRSFADFWGEIDNQKQLRQRGVLLRRAKDVIVVLGALVK